MLFKELSEKWLIDMKGTVKGNTYRYTYQNVVYHHLLPWLASKEIDKIRLSDLQGIINNLNSRFKRDTVTKVKRISKKIFEYAIDNEYLIGRNPATNIVLPASEFESAEASVYSPEQLELIKKYARNHRFGADILFLAETGVRKSELLGLKWSDFDYANKYINIQRSVSEIKADDNTPSKVVVGKTKNRTSKRQIPLTRDLCEVLNNLPRTSEYIFPNSKGQVQRPSVWSKKRYGRFMQDMSEYYLKSGIFIPKLSPHKFRHTRASIWVNSNINIYAVAKVLGHSDIKMLQKCYAHSNIEQIRNLLEIS